MFVIEHVKLKNILYKKLCVLLLFISLLFSGCYMSKTEAILLKPILS